ncbi:hypothetical protein BGZ49_004908, partial [Haplosporangium sp. Z 27]
ERFKLRIIHWCWNQPNITSHYVIALFCCWEKYSNRIPTKSSTFGPNVAVRKTMISDPAASSSTPGSAFTTGKVTQPVAHMPDISTPTVEYFPYMHTSEQENLNATSASYVTTEDLLHSLAQLQESFKSDMDLLAEKISIKLHKEMKDDIKALANTLNLQFESIRSPSEANLRKPQHESLSNYEPEREIQSQQFREHIQGERHASYRTRTDTLQGTASAPSIHQQKQQVENESRPGAPGRTTYVFHNPAFDNPQAFASVNDDSSRGANRSTTDKNNLDHQISAASRIKKYDGIKFVAEQKPGTSKMYVDDWIRQYMYINWFEMTVGDPTQEHLSRDAIHLLGRAVSENDTAYIWFTARPESIRNNWAATIESLSRALMPVQERINRGSPSSIKKCIQRPNENVEIFNIQFNEHQKQFKRYATAVGSQDINPRDLYGIYVGNLKEEFYEDMIDKRNNSWSLDTAQELARQLEARYTDRYSFKKENYLIDKDEPEGDGQFNADDDDKEPGQPETRVHQKDDLMEAHLAQVSKTLEQFTLLAAQAVSRNNVPPPGRAYQSPSGRSFENNVPKKDISQ